MADYRYIIAPWERLVRDQDDAGRWVPPAGAVASLDLRSNLDCGRDTPGDRPVGFFAISRAAPVPSGAAILGDGDLRELSATPLTASAFESLVGYLPAGDRLVDLLFDVLTSGADPAATDAVGCLMPTRALELSIQLQGHSVVKREQFDLNTHPHRNKVLAVLRRQFETSHNRVGRGVLPAGAQQRALDWTLEKYRVPRSEWRTLVPARLRGEISGPLPHATTYVDDFNRANENPLGTASGGWSWTNLDGAGQRLIVDSNVCANDDDTDNYKMSHTPALSGADQYAQTEAAGWMSPNGFRRSQPGPSCRITDESNHYASTYGYSNDTTARHELLKRVSGSFTVLDLDTSLGTAVPGTIIRLEVDGSNQEAFRDAVSELTATDTALSSGDYAGIFMEMSTNTTSGSHRVDNFEAGDLGGGGGGLAPGVHNSPIHSSPIFGGGVVR